MVQDPEHTDYYCPACKAKSKCCSSGLVKHQQKSGYIRNTFLYLYFIWRQLNFCVYRLFFYIVPIELTECMNIFETVLRPTFRNLLSQMSRNLLHQMFRNLLRQMSRNL